MSDPLIGWHIQRLETLRSDRGTWDSQWEEAARRVMPAHTSTFFSRGRVYAKGQKKTQDVVDATPALALQRFQSVMESLATPSNSRWHRLVPGLKELRKDRATMLYLDDLNAQLFQERYRPTANFVAQNQKTLMGYGAYGNGINFVDGNPDGGLRYRNLHLGQCYFVENHQGIVDTLYRSFACTPRQIIAEYGRDGNVPESVFKLAANPNTSEKELDLIHVIIPRSDFDPFGIGPESMPFMSLHIFVQEKVRLREGGYNTFPPAIARYMQFTGETYGRGPTQLVLPSIKLLNEQKKVLLKQAHRNVDPVLLAFDDGAVGTFSLRAGAINSGGVNAQGQALVQPLPVGRVDVGKDALEMERDIVNDAFLLTLFQILTDSPQMTATEVLERTREKGLLIAPTAGRLQAEYLGPMIEREIDVLAQQGRLPDPPPALLDAGGIYHVEYDSPMSRMMRAENASGFMRSLETTLNIVKVTQDPSHMDHYNFDEAIPELNDINGVPVAWTRPLAEVAQIRGDRKKEQQQQQLIENAQGLAQAVSSVGGSIGGDDLAGS